MAKTNKSIGLLRHMPQVLPRKALLSVYKAFIRPHLDYADVVYDQPNNESFCNKIESIQNNASNNWGS